VLSGDDVRRIVLALPETEERETWGHPTFRVRDKMFATLSPAEDSAGVKATREVQAELVAADPRTFAVADYVGRYGWLSVTLAGVDADEMRDLLVNAWRRTAPKRLVTAYDRLAD
jgi:hypothetical protein